MLSPNRCTSSDGIHRCGTPDRRTARAWTNVWPLSPRPPVSSHHTGELEDLQAHKTRILVICGTTASGKSGPCPAAGPQAGREIVTPIPCSSGSRNGYRHRKPLPKSARRYPSPARRGRSRAALSDWADLPRRPMRRSLQHISSRGRRTIVAAVRDSNPLPAKGLVDARVIRGRFERDAGRGPGTGHRPCDGSSVDPQLAGASIQQTGELLRDLEVSGLRHPPFPLQRSTVFPSGLAEPADRDSVERPLLYSRRSAGEPDAGQGLRPRSED